MNDAQGPLSEAQGDPLIWDLFCGAGGCSAGFYQAGFAVKGFDIRPQPHYPFRFQLGDALAFLENVLSGNYTFGWPVAIHASPPCQGYSRTRSIQGNDHPDLITPLRPLLEATGLPYVIENVEGAPLKNPILLDGTMFDGLRTKRPRLFETNWPLEAPFLRHPQGVPNARMGRRPKPDEWMHVVGHFTDVAAGGRAMGIDWMTQHELAEAIPPAYTEFIGKQLLAHIGASV